MGTDGARRGWVIALGVSLLVLFSGLGTLNAFNLPLLSPTSSSQRLVFIALSMIAFLLFVGVLVLLVRNVLKLYGDQRSRVLGTRLRTRMLWGAVLVSLVPLVFMSAFCYLLMNRAMDRWFSPQALELTANASRLADELGRYAAANARSEADTLALELNSVALTSPGQRAEAGGMPPPSVMAATRIFQRHELTLQDGFAVVYHDGVPVASFHLPQGEASPTPQHASHSGPLSAANPDLDSDELLAERMAGGSPLPPTTISSAETLPRELAVLHAAESNSIAMLSMGNNVYSLATAGLRHGGLVVVGLPFPREIAATSEKLQAATDSYMGTYRQRRAVRNLYMELLLLTTGLALFACCWLALNIAKQVTRPVESLAEAMEAIATGNYATRVSRGSTEELGDLIDRFNTMAGDLSAARQAADASAEQLSTLNLDLERRGTELATIIETIPTGVVTLSPERRLLLVNRAFSELVDPGGQRAFVGLSLEEALPAEVIEPLDRLLQRSHRMGSASAELQLDTAQLSAVASLLERGPAGARQHLGYVLVLEDLTEALHAQKQSAWKEVAQRVAHEIKNPLTPIALQAEMIRRHIERMAPTLAEHGVDSPSPAVIRRASEVISSSVETLRELVDQFSTLAEFPASKPRAADLNTIAENALAQFAGRLGSIRVRRRLQTDLPLVLADPEALKRALINLIDNAAEAMSESLLRELSVSTRLLDSGMVELSVGDTGSGLTDEMRERLFLPYFSTKQRGTGLGLSIAAKVIAEHGGTIRAEKNIPVGALFLIELRPATFAELESTADTAKVHPIDRDSQSDTTPRPERIPA